MKHLVPALVFALLFWGCSNDSESDLMDPPNNENELVTYNDNIKSIISNNCLSCHSNPPVNGAPFPLTTYNEVKTRAESGLLLTAISRKKPEPFIKRCWKRIRMQKMPGWDWPICSRAAEIGLGQFNTIYKLPDLYPKVPSSISN